jgi:hypothetical protein
MKFEKVVHINNKEIEYSLSFHIMRISTAFLLLEMATSGEGDSGGDTEGDGPETRRSNPIRLAVTICSSGKVFDARTISRNDRCGFCGTLGVPGSVDHDLLMNFANLRNKSQDGTEHHQY